MGQGSRSRGLGPRPQHAPIFRCANGILRYWRCPLLAFRGALSARLPVTRNWLKHVASGFTEAHDRGFPDSAKSPSADILSMVFKQKIEGKYCAVICKSVLSLRLQLGGNLC